MKAIAREAALGSGTGVFFCAAISSGMGVIPSLGLWIFAAVVGSTLLFCARTPKRKLFRNSN